MNYELDLDASITMKWFEIGIALTTDGATAIIVDALPRATHAAAGEETYTLNDRLHFIPDMGAGSAHVHIPATTDLVDVFGIGGKQARWRRQAKGGVPIRPGSGAVWIVTLVPKDCPEVAVEFSARYSLRADDMVPLQPAHEPVRFPLKLRDRMHGRLSIEPTIAKESKEKGRGSGPRVFICYAHDDDPHIRLAVDFCALLVQMGVDVHMDKLAEGPRMDWGVWAINEIDEADFITILPSPMCKAAGDGRLPSQIHPGIQSELLIIRDKWHVDKEYWTPRLLPVVLPGEKLENVPTFLQPNCADHYIVDELTEEGIKDLLRAMGRGGSGNRPPIR
ncbi:SEFIR domain-containing protein [Spongiactinospora sp. 9N601]